MENRPTSPFAFWKKAFQNVRQYRFLLSQLIKVGLLSGVKKSILGWIWLILLPLMTVLVWIFMKNSGIIQPGETGVPYPAFVFFSTTLWGLFYQVYHKMGQVLVENTKLVIANKIPFELLIIQSLVVQLVKGSIPLVLSIGVLLYYQVALSWESIFGILLIIPLIWLGIGLGLVASIFRVVALDLGNLMDEGMKLLFFITPVLYSTNVKVGLLSDLIRYNPLTYLLDTPRMLVLFGKWENVAALGGCSFGALILCLVLVQFHSQRISELLQRMVQQ